MLRRDCGSIPHLYNRSSEHCSPLSGVLLSSRHLHLMTPRLDVACDNTGFATQRSTSRDVFPFHHHSMFSIHQFNSVQPTTAGGFQILSGCFVSADFVFSINPQFPIYVSPKDLIQATGQYLISKRKMSPQCYWLVAHQDGHHLCTHAKSCRWQLRGKWSVTNNHEMKTRVNE